jgi:SMC interacting uncharacterized protein involved in chromosome segregation
MSDTVLVALITVGTPVLSGFMVWAWKQITALRKSKEEEKRRVNKYQKEATQTVETLERENEELHLDLEASEEQIARDQATITSQDDIIRSQQEALQSLAQSYESLANGKAVSQ